MRSRFHTLVAAVLVACFSVYLVPNELVHALYGHEDTHHHECETPGGPSAVSTHHTHCDFLSYEGDLFTAASSTDCPVSSEHAFAFFIAETAHAGNPAAVVHSPRGPPLS